MRKSSTQDAALQRAGSRWKPGTYRPGEWTSELRAEAASAVGRHRRLPSVIGD